MDDLIHVIGDSHSLFWSGWEGPSDKYPLYPQVVEMDRFRVYHIGPAPATTLGLSGGYGNMLHEIISGLPEHSTVMLSFGEIDCRCHFPRFEDWRKIVDEGARRYANAIQSLEDQGLRVLVWGPPPTTPTVATMGGYDTVGDQRTRNAITRYFTERLLVYLAPIVTILSELIDQNGDTRQEYLWDGIHLNASAMPMALNALQDVFALLREGK